MLAEERAAAKNAAERPPTGGRGASVRPALNAVGKLPGCQPTSRTKPFSTLRTGPPNVEGAARTVADRFVRKRTVSRATVARSASGVPKLRTGRPSSVRSAAALHRAAGDTRGEGQGPGGSVVVIVEENGGSTPGACANRGDRQAGTARHRRGPNDRSNGRPAAPQGWARNCPLSRISTHSACLKSRSAGVFAARHPSMTRRARVLKSRASNSLSGLFKS